MKIYISLIIAIIVFAFSNSAYILATSDTLMLCSIDDERCNKNMPFYSTMNTKSNNSPNLIIQDPCPPFWQICDMMLFLKDIQNNSKINDVDLTLNVSAIGKNITSSYHGSPSEVIIGLTNSSIASIEKDEGKAIAIDSINHILRSIISTARDSGISHLGGQLNFNIHYPNSLEKSNGDSLNVTMLFR